MSPAAWATLALLGIGVLAWAFVRLPPRRAAALLVLVAAGALALARQFALALPLAVFGLGLWQSGSDARAAPTPGQRSEVRTRWLAMTLDHDSGEMDGEVLEGSFQGVRLSQLSQDDLQRLVAQIDAVGDEDSLSLLFAYLDRRRGPEPEGAPRGEPPPDGAAMSEAEAYRVLGLPQGATVEEVRAAYRRLMKRVHPDLGGSSALAAILNAAKDRLDPDGPRP